jgi:hypothetical protein
MIKMAAAAYKISMTVLDEVTKERKSIALTATDVANAYWLYPSGASVASLGPNTTKILDIMLSAAGTDTTATEIYVNGANSGVKLMNSANLYNGVGRQSQALGMRIGGGNTIEFKQVTA